jgi:phage gp45-like
MIDIKNIFAKVRNLFCMSDFQKRYDEDDRIQIKTHNGKVLEKNEAFPYGFYAKAKAGKALIFCQGGNFDNFEILPVLKDEPVFRPELKDGDAAIYTGEGSYIILREEGDLEIYTRKQGNIIITCTGNCIATIDGNCETEIKGDSTINCAGDSTITVGGDSDITVDGNSNVTIGGDSAVAVNGNCACDVIGDCAITARRIDLN